MKNQIYRPPAYSHNTWRKEQIFEDMATAYGIISGGVVPNVNDEVVSWSGNIKFEERVTAVDPVTNLSTLEPIEYPNNGNEAIIGVPVGVGNLSNVANLLLNPSDAKLSSVVDSRLPIYGTDLRYARIFLGNDISSSGRIISMNLDTTGKVIDDKVILEKADVGDEDLLRYIARPFNLSTKLDEDTLVTMVVYSDVNNMVMWQELVVKHNHVVANVQSSKLFINDVVLESAYQNPTNNKELLVPKNLLNTSFTPRIFKNYQTGQREELFIGTSNVNLNGWGDYITGEVNERFTLVLTYVLGNGELSNNVDKLTGTHLTNTYEVVIVDNDLATEVKLFVTPKYINSSAGYTLEFWLYTGKRDTPVNVTDKVVVDNFNGTSYGLKQKVDFSLVLDDLGSFNITSFADSIDIQLLGEPMANATMYRLWYYRGDTRYYGENLRAKLLNNFGTNTLSINNYYEQFSEWLDDMYYRAIPLYDSSVDSSAPKPTHVDIIVDGVTLTMEIDTYWNGELRWDGEVPINGTNVILQWYLVNDVGSRLDLAITNMPLEVI